MTIERLRRHPLRREPMKDALAPFAFERAPKGARATKPKKDADRDEHADEDGESV